MKTQVLTNKNGEKRTFYYHETLADAALAMEAAAKEQIEDVTPEQIKQASANVRVRPDFKPGWITIDVLPSGSLYGRTLEVFLADAKEGADAITEDLAELDRVKAEYLKDLEEAQEVPSLVAQLKLE